MSYRPICDVWILARPKLKDKQKYDGAYPAGFLHRARHLLGVGHEDPVLHVCAGLVRQSLYRGFGPNDKTVDLCEETEPDFLMDARRLGFDKDGLFPCPVHGNIEEGLADADALWPAILIDRPYTTADHAEYDVPPDVFPADLNELLRRALTCVAPGGRVGVLDYVWPSPPSRGKAAGKEVAVVAVGTGRNQRARWFTVFERLIPNGNGKEEAAEDVASALSPEAESMVESKPSDETGERPKKKTRRKKKAKKTTTTGDDKRRKAMGMKECKACGGSGKNSKGGLCICQSKLPAAGTCHGCKESLQLDGLDVISPPTDLPHRWHQACWDQKVKREKEAAAKWRDDRDREEARKKGYPICSVCARAVMPTQRNEGGKHYACAGKPKANPFDLAFPAPRRRRRRTK